MLVHNIPRSALFIRGNSQIKRPVLLGVVAYVCNPSTREVGRRTSQVQDQPGYGVKTEKKKGSNKRTANSLLDCKGDSILSGSQHHKNREGIAGSNA